MHLKKGYNFTSSHELQLTSCHTSRKMTTMIN